MLLHQYSHSLQVYGKETKILYHCNYGTGGLRRLGGKLFKQDIYALTGVFTLESSKVDHKKLMWIMYDLRLPADAIDVVKYLYSGAHTQIRLPLGEYNIYQSTGEPYKETPYFLFFS
jgi:hypothetical protein